MNADNPDWDHQRKTFSSALAVTFRANTLKKWIQERMAILWAQDTLGVYTSLPALIAIRDNSNIKLAPRHPQTYLRPL